MAGDTFNHRLNVHAPIKNFSNKDKLTVFKNLRIHVSTAFIYWKKYNKILINPYATNASTVSAHIQSHIATMPSSSSLF